MILVETYALQVIVDVCMFIIADLFLIQSTFSAYYMM